MSVDADYVKREFSIFDLVYEAQQELGYEVGLIDPRSARDQKTRCPVHFDSSPSSKVYAGTNSVYCWVCGRTWDTVSLYAAVYGVSYRRAVSTLLGRLGAHTGRQGASDDLAALASFAANPSAPKPTPVSEKSVDAVLDSLLEWVYAQPLSEFPALDLIEDAAAGWLRYMPLDEVVSSVRDLVAYCRVVHPSLPAPPVLNQDSLTLFGLSS